MNVGIITSFVVGGLMLLSILAFNGQVLNNSIENSISTINQTKINEIAEFVTNDFQRIGYQTGDANPFIKILEKDVIFEADVFDGDTYGVTNVRWFFDSSDNVTSSTNPNDYMLKRTGPLTNSTYGTTEFPVTHFSITYKTANDNVTTNTAIVKKIEVHIVLESPEPYGTDSSGADLYHRTVWKRTFVPNNINLPY